MVSARRGGLVTRMNFAARKVMPFASVQPFASLLTAGLRNVV
jgi:hypothetical protein